MERFIGIIGYLVLFGMLILLSNNRRNINIRTVAAGIFLQFLLGLLLLKWHAGAGAIQFVADKVAGFLNLTDNATTFLFGNLVKPELMETVGFQFAFKVLPVIIFFSAFMAILYYLGVMQIVVQAFAWVMSRLMRTSGAESLSCSANIFVGQTEAPLIVRPFLSRVTMSEMGTIMVGGFGTIAGSVMAGYIMMGIPPHYIIIASTMAAPTSLMVGKLLFPEIEKPETLGTVRIPKIDAGTNLLDAASKGTSDGLHLALNVAAMLVAFITLIAFVDVVLGYIDKLIDGGVLGGQLMENGEYAGCLPGSLKTLFGAAFAPLVYLMGVPSVDIKAVGHLLGLKIASNEFVAYSALAPLIKGGAILPKSQMIATFMLCGFANFASIGIQIGGISALAPERRSDLAKLGLKAMIGGAIVSCLTATIAGILY